MNSNNYVKCPYCWERLQGKDILYEYGKVIFIMQCPKCKRMYKVHKNQVVGEWPSG